MISCISGVPKSRWKMVQVIGRMGRRRGDKAVFITVIPGKQRARGVLNGHFQCVCKYDIPRHSCREEGVQAGSAVDGVRYMPERWPLRGVQDQEPNRWSIFSIYPYQLSSQFYMEIRLSKKAAQPACVATHVPRSAQDLVVRTKTKVKMKLYAPSCLLTPRPLN